MRRWIFSVVLTLGMISISGRVSAQVTISNSTGTLMWPNNPPVGIGTQLSFPVGPLNALHIHFNSSDGHSDTAILRLSEGAGTNSNDFGILGLMDYSDVGYSSLSTGNDLILHQNMDGDIIITNYSTPPASHAFGTAIRFATTGDTNARAIPHPTQHDLERETILGNGNIGFDLPPNDTTGLGSPYEQMQLGGGSIPLAGYVDPMPGLSFYGGNRFEGMPYSGGVASVDWRSINFNQYHNAWTGTKYRFAHMPSSGIAFSQEAGGLVELIGQPYDSTLGLNNFTHNVTFQISGQQGLSMYTYFDSSIANLHLFDIWPPGYQGYGGPTDTVTNDSGLCVIHTPVYIGGGPSWFTPNFTNFSHVNPDIGDGHTWQLVVNGPELAREVYVLDSTWADYVFDPGYKLPPLGEVENFVKTNHHLPDIEPASKIAKTGVPLGRTEEALTKKVEELTLYVIDQNKKIEQLEADMQELKNQKEK